MTLRPLAFLVATLGSAFSGTAQLSLESLGDPFDGSKVEIAWDAPTNDLPAALTTFKVRPTIFPSEVVSNLIDLCGFANPQKVREAFRAAARGKTASYKEPYPGKPVFGKFLQIASANGYIIFHNPTAGSLPRASTQGVPSQERALEMTLDLLSILGISVSDLTRKTNSTQLDYYVTQETNGRFDKQQKSFVDEVATRGIILFRQVNGVSFSGPGDCGGLRVEFGNHGQIKELALAWRGLTPDKNVSPPAPPQIVERIKSGQAVIRLPDQAAVAGPITKLVITRARPYYFGLDGGDPQKTVYPYAMLTATATTAVTNFVASLSCPIFK